MRRHLAFVASLLAVIPSVVHAACMPVSYVNPVSAQVATVGGAYDFTVPADTFDPAFPAITYEADQGTGDPITYGEPLPAWLSFEAGEGRFHGTPASGDVGAYNLRLTAFSGACNGEGLFTLTVSEQQSGGGSSGITTSTTKFAIRKYFGEAPIGGSSSSSSSSSSGGSGGGNLPPAWVTAANLGTFAQGTPISPIALSATDTDTPVSYSLVSGALPNGMALSGGVISGTPAIDGSFTVTLRATDALGATADRVFSMTVDASGGLVSQGTTCKGIKNGNGSAADGLYVIDPDGAGGDDPFRAYCDMTTDGGGWTLVARSLAPSTWTVSNEYALSHYDHYIDGDNYTVDAMKLVAAIAPSDWDWRAFDPISPADMDVRFTFSGADYLTVDPDSTANEHTPYLDDGAAAGSIVNTNVKTHGCTSCSSPAWLYGLRMLTADDYSQYYCGGRPSKSAINFTQGNNYYPCVSICANGLGGYVINAAPSAYEFNTTDVGRRVAVAMRETVNTGTINHTPYFTSAQVTGATEGELYAYSITATDADSDPLDITSNDLSGSAWLSFADNGNGTATLEGTPTDADISPVSVTLTVDDGTDTATQVFQIAINFLPVWQVPLPGDLGPFTEGDVIDPSVALSATDEGAVTYSLASGSLPLGVLINGDAIEGTPTETGTFPFVVRATDAQGKYADISLTMTIDPAAPPVAQGLTCKGILGANPLAADGMYLIDPDGTGGNDPFNVFCDMTTDGGGWTVVAMSTTPSTWSVGTQYALSHYDHYINDSNYTVDAKKVLQGSSSTQWTWRAYDPISVADMDVQHTINRADYLAVNPDSSDLEISPHLSDTPLSGWTINLAVKNYGCGGSLSSYKYLRMLEQDAYSSTYCSSSVLSAINLTSANESYAHVTICSVGLRGYTGPGCGETNNSDAGRRVAVAMREVSGPTSCKAIKDSIPGAPDGIYEVDPDGAGTGLAPFQVYCDMTTSGGGWTLISRDPGTSYDVPSPSSIQNGWVGNLANQEGILSVPSNILFALSPTSKGRFRMDVTWFENQPVSSYAALGSGTFTVGPGGLTYNVYYHPLYPACSFAYLLYQSYTGSTCPMLANVACAYNAEGTAGAGDANWRSGDGCWGNPSIGPTSGEVWVR